MRDRIEVDGVLYERVASTGKPLAAAPTVNQITNHRKTIALGRTLRVETVYRRDRGFDEYAVKLMPIGKAHHQYILVIDLDIDNHEGTADVTLATQYGSTVRRFDEDDNPQRDIANAKRLFDRLSKWIFDGHDVDLDEDPESAMRSVLKLADEASEKFRLEED